MTIQDIEKKLIFKHIRGSQMFGTNTPESDTDLFGIFMHNDSDYADLQNPQDEVRITDDENYQDLKKYIWLAKTANPTVIETLWCPNDCVIQTSDAFEYLKSHRKIFVTKKCYHSFSGYAKDQIKKASGKNKKVHSTEKMVNPEGVTYLKKLYNEGKITEEFLESNFSKSFAIYILKGLDKVYAKVSKWHEMYPYIKKPIVSSMSKPRREQFLFFSSNHNTKEGPFRPKLLEEIGSIDATRIGLSSMEHTGNVFRAYTKGFGIKFDSDGNPGCETISLDREKGNFTGLIIFNKEGYERANSEWTSFWDWMAHRNEERWKQDSSGEEFEYDRKNMSHTIRLLLSAENIVNTGEPLIRLTDEKLQYVRDIRAGKFSYTDLMTITKDKTDNLKEQFEKSDLPDQVDLEKVREIYFTTRSMFKK